MQYAPLAELQRLRSYSRLKENKTKESWEETCKRTIYSEYDGIAKLGKLTPEETELVYRMQYERKGFGSSRNLWVGGTPWFSKPENYSGGFNCTNLEVTSFSIMAELMNLAMMGSGTGAVLEERFINQIPEIKNALLVQVAGFPGLNEPVEETTVTLSFDHQHAFIVVGDSRKGWVDAYRAFLELSIDTRFTGSINAVIDVSHVRAKGEMLKGFGGVSNPVKLPEMFPRLAEILNGAVGRKLTSVECCLLIDEAGVVVVAGNIRRSAGMRQFASADTLAAEAKLNLYIQDSEGNWKVDPKRQPMTMANHTRVYHKKPSLDEIKDAVTKQFYSGEGAIQYAPEAIARANVDVLNTSSRKSGFLQEYDSSREEAEDFLKTMMGYCIGEGVIEGFNQQEVDHRMNRYGLNPCFVAGTMIMTRKGHFPIESLVGQTVEVWDGSEWVEIENFRVTGENQPVYTLKLSNGQTVTATAYHKFILEDGTRKELRELKPKDRLLTHDQKIHGIHNEKAAYLKGFLVGDGTMRNGKAALDLYTPKYVCKERLINSAQELEVKELAGYGVKGHYKCTTELGFRPSQAMSNRETMQGLVALDEDLTSWVGTFRKCLPNTILNWDLPSKLDFIAGVLDADGTASDTTHGFLYQIVSIRKEWLESFQVLLRTIGVKSKLSNADKGGIKDFGKGGIYNTQPSWRLTISQEASIALANQVVFSRLKSFASKSVTYKVKSRESIIESVEFSHVADKVYCCTVPTNHQVSLSNGLVTGQCGEIIGATYHCNLSSFHLNMLDPFNFEGQAQAIKASALQAASFLQRGFTNPLHQQSRDLDPIVGVSFTGAFTFFAKAFGIDWLRWWQAGRPDKWGEDTVWYPLGTSFSQSSAEIMSLSEYFKIREQEYLMMWRNIVEQTVWEYCDRHGLKRPNRCTTLKPEGSQTLLTGVGCNGHHAPKGWRYIRRMTFRRDDPIALAAMDYGYSVIPSTSDKDEHGNLLNDPFDPRCTEWLVEVPVEEEIVSLFPEAENIDPSKFSALAQFDWYMQIQKYYVTHNTSATLEFRQDEIEPLSQRIYEAIQKDEGYVSAALLARFDANETFPRLPFEPISKDKYDDLVFKVQARRKSNDFQELFNSRLAESQEGMAEPQDSACGDGFCAIK